MSDKAAVRCAWCREPFLPGEDAYVVDGELMHLSCVAEEEENATFDRDMGFS